MEASAAEESAPQTPAAVSQSVLPSTDSVIETVDHPKIFTKQRQRTRRACYPCSKVCRISRKCTSSEKLTSFHCSEKSNAIAMSRHHAATVGKGQIQNSAHSTMTGRDLVGQGTPPTQALLHQPQVL